MTGDTLEVRVRDADTDDLLDTIMPLPAFPSSPAWQSLGPFGWPATADDNTICLGFRFLDNDSEHLGFSSMTWCSATESSRQQPHHRPKLAHARKNMAQIRK
ncbi:hypothetical protein [Haloferula sp. A504]|uniref:hypothetical protein n=1 Tax=Haloferula sp. A504 TaxID=3373601 RepID=UPI0031C82672|nr:hypothetical protein [Verrucomicrobiaceae bacterium E54]